MHLASAGRGGVSGDAAHVDRQVEAHTPAAELPDIAQEHLRHPRGARPDPPAFATGHIAEDLFFGAGQAPRLVKHPSFRLMIPVVALVHPKPERLRGIRGGFRIKDQRPGRRGEGRNPWRPAPPSRDRGGYRRIRGRRSWSDSGS